MPPTIGAEGAAAQVGSKENDHSPTHHKVHGTISSLTRTDSSDDISQPPHDHPPAHKTRTAWSLPPIRLTRPSSEFPRPSAPLGDFISSLLPQQLDTDVPLAEQTNERGLIDVPSAHPPHPDHPSSRSFPAARRLLTACLGAAWNVPSRALVEWLEYHTLLGVEHFFLYDNDGSLAEVVEAKLGSPGLATESRALILEPGEQAVARRTPAGGPSSRIGPQERCD